MKNPEASIQYPAARKQDDQSGVQHPVSRIQKASPFFLLPLVTVAVFWPVATHDFLNFDDQIYVTENARVLGGLTWTNVGWALTTLDAGFWHPLTWLSFLLDSELYGLWAGGYHLTNLLLHLASTVLLFGVLRRLTGALWRSAFVAALFALHPLHVEPVTWVASRKDVLSAVFWMLTLWAYSRYAENEEGRRKNEESRSQHPASSRQSVSSFFIQPFSFWFWYGLALFFFALGLMSKAMLVTLPFVLLLLDYWPLKRMQNAELRMKNPEASRQYPAARKFLHSSFNLLPSLVWEKLPFLALAVVLSLVTYYAEEKMGAVLASGSLPLSARLANAVTAYVRYLGNTVYPVGLTVFYPYPRSFAFWQVAGAVLILVSITMLVIRTARRRPYLLVGWFWFLGTLVPVIGLIQVGSHSMADRYTYLPLIGLFMMVAWGMQNVECRMKKPDGLLHSSFILLPFLGAVLVLLACALTSWFQLRHWRDSETLFSHAAKVTRDNAIALSNLGLAKSAKGDWEAAIACFREILRRNPAEADDQLNLGAALASQGNREAGLRHFREALRLRPGYADAYFNLGNAMAEEGNYAEAESYFREALRLKPGYAEAYENFGKLLALQGRMEEAIRHYEEAVRLRPLSAETRYSLGTALAQQQRFAPAAAQFKQALRYDPRHAAAANDLARLLATATDPATRNPREAVRWAERACELTANQVPAYLDTLGTAYSEAGQFNEAVQAAERGAALARAAGDKELGAILENRLMYYRQGRAFHSIPKGAAP